MTRLLLATLALAGCTYVPDFTPEKRFRIPTSSMEPTLHCVIALPGETWVERKGIVVVERDGEEIELD